MSEEFDYSGFEEPTSTEGELGTLSNLAENARSLEGELENMRLSLKKKEEALKTIVEFQIPEIMDRIGMKDFSTSQGLKVKIMESIRASMGTGANKIKNLAWLRQEGHEAVLKTSVLVPFGKGEEQEETARVLAQRLSSEGLSATLEQKVEPSTLSSLIRELLQEGRPVPEEQFGVFRQRVAKIF